MKFEGRRFKRSALAGAALAAALQGGLLFAEAPSASTAGFFPASNQSFQPLLADPRELQLALRLVFPVSNKDLGAVQGEASLGAYWGLYRWAWPGADASLQLSLGGGVFALFDMVRATRDLQVADYDADIPLDFRVGRWSSRFLVYHVSSHWGDDYVARTQAVVQKYAMESVKWLVSYDAGDHWRLYGGPIRIFHTLQTVPGLNALQGGMEWHSSWRARGHAQAYWAGDWQSWERVNWSSQWNTQLGLRVRNRPGDMQGLAVFLEYSAGKMPYGQFFEQQQSRWALGARFYLP
jgi:hypothetical protein